MPDTLLRKIAAGRTDLVFEWINQGHSPDSTDQSGVSLMQWCSYYGDVSAIRLLVANGSTLESLGENYDLNGAVFHGHLNLSEFLIENGANVNFPLVPTGETPLHSALCKTDRETFDPILALLLQHGADPNCKSQPGVETESFMRDIRTRGEAPLHRAAAFGNEKTIQLLLDASARVDVRDMNGDSPLTWASWHLRPRSILRLCASVAFAYDRQEQYTF
ncbi:MAG: ankyrin repeat domain-containing protein [Pirellulaceae bacterium]